VHLGVKIGLGFVAFLHCFFLTLEMFLWTTPYGQKVFQRTAAQQLESAILAKNQGLYNGFLAAGLIWAIVAPPGLGVPVARFFLGCVIVAGLYGGATAARSILVLQALPAAVVLALLFFL
jgi:putative membrane protein